MANRSKIEWCDLTINPIVGCTKCSPGCDNCYAEKFSARLARNPKTAKRYSFVVAGGKWNGKIDVSLKDAFKGLSLGKPRLIFVGSMGDAFHENVSTDAHVSLFECLRLFPQHTFMLLTKRPRRMSDAINGLKWVIENTGPEDGNPFPVWPLPNVWLGVTACNQAEADEKIPILLSTPAEKRFVSIEPMLGPVDLFRLKRPEHFHRSPYGWKQWLARNLHWVIVGGETGPGARPMHPDWARSIRDQCQATGIPFFFKRWGTWGFAPGNDATHGLKSDGTLLPCRPGQDLDGAWPCRKMGKRSGSEMDGREWRESPS